MLSCRARPHRQAVEIISSSFTSQASLARTRPLVQQGLGRKSAVLATAEILNGNFAPTGNHRLDRAAIWFSGICLVHCLAIPFAVLALPVIGDHLLGSETLVHWLLLAPAVPVSIFSLWFGYRRHDYLTGLLIGTAGLSLMFIGVSHLIDRSYEIPLTVAGVLLVSIAHVLNMRRLRKVPPSS